VTRGRGSPIAEDAEGVRAHVGEPPRQDPPAIPPVPTPSPPAPEPVPSPPPEPPPPAPSPPPPNDGSMEFAPQ
jgi:hypothetical protein